MLEDGSSPILEKPTLAEARCGESVLVSVFDADPGCSSQLRGWLEQAGYRVFEQTSRARAPVNDGEHPQVAFVDLGSGELRDLERIQRLRVRDADLPIIVVVPEYRSAVAMEAARLGADDALTKPLDRDRVLLAVHRACERRELIANVRRLEAALGERSVLGAIVGQSAKMRELAQQVERVIASDVAVCVVGESGTGKELVARALHAGGPRRRGNFVAFNCAGIPESILEAELFGRERGGFAADLCRGSFEQANGGTLLLEEVGELSRAAQGKLLRTLEDQCVRRVGGSSTIPIDVRIICATRRDLRRDVEAGRFREDLFLRLFVYSIQLPPLRERSEDIPLLVGHFVKALASEVGREVERISPEALDALARYRWPGNVRELRSVVQRSLLASRSDEITLSDLPAEIRGALLPAIVPVTRLAGVDTHRDEEILPLRELERRAIQRALRATRGSVGKAAKLLGIGRATLYRRIATLDLSQDVA